MERLVIIVNCFQPLTIMTKHSILDVAAVLDPPLIDELLNWITFLNLKTTNFGEGFCVYQGSVFFSRKKKTRMVSYQTRKFQTNSSE